MKESRFLEVDVLKEYNENKHESCTMLEYLYEILGEERCRQELNIKEMRGYKNWDSTKY